MKNFFWTKREDQKSKKFCIKDRTIPQKISLKPKFSNSCIKIARLWMCISQSTLNIQGNYFLFYQQNFPFQDQLGIVKEPVKEFLC